MSEATNGIIIALISAGLAALVNCIFQIVNKFMDHRRENKLERYNHEKGYIAKKEQVYIAAIDRLLYIRRGFDYTREDLNKELKEQVQKSNAAFFEIAAQLRLYANDKIFNEYDRLAQFAVYAYAPERRPRLTEESKRIYSIWITWLARQMQEDLGYRKYNKDCERITCPVCGVEHDMISQCPNCGLTYEEMLQKLQECVRQLSEADNSSTQNED